MVFFFYFNTISLHTALASWFCCKEFCAVSVSLKYRCKNGVSRNINKFHCNVCFQMPVRICCVGGLQRLWSCELLPYLQLYWSRVCSILFWFLFYSNGPETIWIFIWQQTQHLLESASNFSTSIHKKDQVQRVSMCIQSDLLQSLPFPVSHLLNAFVEFYGTCEKDPQENSKDLHMSVK